MHREGTGGGTAEREPLEVRRELVRERQMEALGELVGKERSKAEVEKEDIQTALGDVVREMGFDGGLEKMGGG